jgi:ATP-dependent helicase/nuclease subunit A
VVIAGTIDRMLIAPDGIRIIDFKTGLHVPADVDAIPVAHMRQMAAYVGALEVIFPDRPVTAAIVYTAGPRFLPIDPERLAPFKPGLEGTKDNL